MEEPIEHWLKRLDQILEHQQFESAAEAEEWMRKQVENRSVEEFLSENAPPAVRLQALWDEAEKSQDAAVASELFARAVTLAETEFAGHIVLARQEPSKWEEGPAALYLSCLFGWAASCEALSEFAEAEAIYVRLHEEACGDPLGAREKLFSLCLMDGRLEEAQQWLHDETDDESASILYQRALLRFLVAADEAEQAYQESGDEAAAASWEDAQANKWLRKAIRTNPFAARLIGHPRAFDLEYPAEAAAGSPAEGVKILFSSAHLWLSDFLALAWMLGELKQSPALPEEFAAEWSVLLEKLGGEPSDEERFAFLRSLEEMDL
jgi:hypothetical protein